MFGAPSYDCLSVKHPSSAAPSSPGTQILMFALQLNASAGIVKDWEDVVGETPTTATETVRAPRTVKIVGLRGFGRHIQD